MREQFTEAELRRHLRTAADEALETMCFSPVLGPAPPQAGSEPGVLVHLGFTGDACGRLWLEMSAAAAAHATANFLGQTEQETDRTQMEMVTCELANMICGNVLSRLDPYGHFDLSSPQTAVELDAPAQAVEERLALETGSLQMWIAFA
jgi:CheY-specific phosphatase CheX